MSYLNSLLIPKPNYQAIAHRGVPSERPENTIPSFRRAVELGLNWAEFDARLTACDNWVVFHDSDLKRIADKNIVIEEASLSELASIDIGSHFGPEYSVERIPTLKSLIDFAYKNNLYLNLEVKDNNKSAKHHATTLMEFLYQNINKNQAMPLISSFDLNVLKAVRRLDNEISIGYLLEKTKDNTWDLIDKYNFTTLNISNQYASKRDIYVSYQKRIPTLIYTVNDRDEALHWFKAGASALFTDKPEEIKLAYQQLQEVTVERTLTLD